MRKRDAVIWSLGPLLALLAVASPAPLSAGAEAEILSLLRSQEEAWNKGDLESFMAGYWNSEQLTFYSGGQIQNGWQATIERYRRRYQGQGQSMGRLTFSGLSIDLLSAESAFVRGRWQLEMPDSSRPGGLFTLIVKKLPKGWKIVHDHTSSQQ